MNKVYEFTPYGVDGNLGKAYNEYCYIVPYDDDWIMMTDQDSMILTPRYGHVINAYLEGWKDIDLWTCKVNRINDPRALEPGMYKIDSIKKHREKALELAEKELSVFYTRRTISGYMMLFRKSLWRQLGGFKDGFFGVDTDFSKRVLKSGRNIGIMQTVYAMHYYRLKEGTKKDGI